MGVEMRARSNNVAPAYIPVTEAHYAPERTVVREQPSPYAIQAVDGTGHMRKLEDLEAEIIRMAISRYDGHMSEVARRLAIGRSTLYRKLKDLGLEPEGEGSDAADSQEGPRAAAL